MCVYVCLCVWMCTCMYACLFVCVPVYTCVYMCACVCMVVWERQHLMQLRHPKHFCAYWWTELELLSPYFTSARIVALWDTTASLQSGVSNTAIFTYCVRAPPTEIQPQRPPFILCIINWHLLFFLVCYQLGYSCHWNYRPVLASHRDPKIKGVKTFITNVTCLSSDLL